MIRLRYFSKRTINTFSSATRKNQQKITPLGWSLLAVPVTTFGLGCWQVKRKIWKENLIKDLAQQLNSDPVPLPENLDDLDNYEYRPVIVRGKFIYDKELYLGPRTLIQPNQNDDTQGGIFTGRNESIGYLTITPFKLTGREEIILVNRGWVPRKSINPQNRKEKQMSSDEIELIGIVRKGEDRGQFLPDHKRGDIYLYRDLNKMCAETGAQPIFIDANYNSTLLNGPIGGQTRVTLRNDHLSYLITWFSLSAVTSYMWYRQIFKGKSF